MRSNIDPTLKKKFEWSAENFRRERIPVEQLIVDDEWLKDSDKENNTRAESVV
jgi:hypothetical protein